MRYVPVVTICAITLVLAMSCSSSGNKESPAEDLTAGPPEAGRGDSARSVPDRTTTPDADIARFPDLPTTPDSKHLDLPADLPTEKHEIVDAVPVETSLQDIPTGDSADVPDTAPDLAPDVPPPALVDVWETGTVVAQCGAGLLALLPTPSGDLRILVVRGSHYDMGYQAGCLVGKDVGQFFDNLVAYFLAEVGDAAAEIGLDPDQSATLLFAMLNNIWLHVAPFVSDEYMQEIAGFEAAVFDEPDNLAAWGETKPEWALRALILLSNISDLNWSGSLEAVLDKLDTGTSPQLTAFYSEDTAALVLDRFLQSFRRVGPRLPFRTSCSFFAAWGDRTVDNHLLASRNLDWSTDTGISVMKGITIFAPEGEIAHASIGYLGFIGSLAGMNEAGVALSEVGSESVMERLTGQPWTVKFRDILGHASSLEQAVEMATGTADDAVRPPTIGYNWMAAFGDPPLGLGAAAAAIESNGIVAGVLQGTPDCGQTAQLVHYAQDGSVAQVVSNDEAPFEANLESEAVEINADGEPRLFQVDEEGTIILDDNGNPVPAAQGKAFPVGKPLSCALFRGDEALVHGVRRWQTASHGPQGGESLLCTSGSYKHRYLVMHDMLEAYESGSSYSHSGVDYIEETGSKTPVGLPQAEQIARAAAMGSNVLSIAYDATALRIRVSWEIGTGDSWEPAHKHDYIEIDLHSIFQMLKMSQ